jgi:ADP-heptose:LPS heptosyltransferase
MPFLGKRCYGAAAATPEPLLLQFSLSPGDTVVGTAAIECLHQQHPGKYLTAVAGTAAEAIFANNPHISARLDKPRPVLMEYPLVHQSGQRLTHFIEGYVRHLSEQLGISVEPLANRPYLYLSDEEKSWVDQVEEITGKKAPYWVVCSGVKPDYTVKGWGHSNYQKVVGALADKVFFVQVGEAGHSHPPLDGVLNLVGKTDTRQLIRLCYNARGGLGGVSLLHHVMAAFEKPMVTLASGMEAVSWERYNSEVFLHRGACLPCGNRGKGCWKARVAPLGDSSSKDTSLCERPAEGIPGCLALIRPEEVIDAIMAYEEGLKS